MNRKNNKRFKDTEQLIQQSLIELLEGRELRQISVREICEKAGINRSTFYAHYLDIYDLMEKIDVNMSENLLEQFAGMVEPQNFLSITTLEVFFEFIYSNQKFYRDFVHNQHTYPIQKGFEALWHNIMVPHYISLEITSDEEMMYHFVYFQAGLTTVLKRWLDQGCKESPKKLADILNKNFLK